MATKPATRENSAITEANREMEKALQNLDEQIQKYEKFGQDLIAELQRYHKNRSRWLL